MTDLDVPLPEPPAADADRLVGVLISERYKVVRKLGEGGMGAVYEAQHTLLRRRCAIKVLHPEFAMRAEVVARFHREALAASAVGNPHIVEVSDMGYLPDRTLFMVLEFLDGEDFSHLLAREGPLPIDRTIHIIDQLLDGLGAAHSKGIVHRDLKPENMFLMERNGDRDFVKILDFGISKFLDPGDPSGGMTRTGASMGTPYYMAPEQFEQSKDVDTRADLWSVGVILFQALSGRFPFEATSYPGLVVQVCTRTAPTLVSVRPNAPRALSDIIARLLSPSRDDRFPDCASVREVLRPFIGVRKSVEPDPQAPISIVSPRDVTDLGLAMTRAASEPPHPSVVAIETAQRVPSLAAPARTARGPIAAALFAATIILGGTGVWFSQRAPRSNDNVGAAVTPLPRAVEPLRAVEPVRAPIAAAVEPSIPPTTAASTTLTPTSDALPDASTVAIPARVSDHPGVRQAHRDSHSVAIAAAPPHPAAAGESATAPPARVEIPTPVVVAPSPVTTPTETPRTGEGGVYNGQRGGLRRIPGAGVATP